MKDQAMCLALFAFHYILIRLISYALKGEEYSVAIELHTGSIRKFKN